MDPALQPEFRAILCNLGTLNPAQAPGDSELRGIHRHGGGVHIDGQAVRIEERDGRFHEDCTTDLRTSPGWGVHRAVRWRYDPAREAAQHLVVGTDKGLLYLLRAAAPTDPNEPPYRYESAGPLRDTHGIVIEIHERVLPAGVPFGRTGGEAEERSRPLTPP